jgi:diguanylate cyclase (GGDEF)-like protein
MTPTPFLLAVLFGLAGPVAAARAGDCPDLEAQAREIAAQRDVDPALGVERGDAALAQARTLEVPCPVGEAMLLAATGTNLHILARNREAVERYRQALELLAAPEATPAQLATVHRGAGVALADIDAYDEALGHYLQALSASQAAGDTLEAAKTAGNIGNLYTALGELERSRQYHQHALDGFQAIDFKPGIAGTLVNLGSLAAKFASSADEAGRDDEARTENQRLRELNEQALALFTELGNERGIAYASSNIALALDRLGEPAQALPFHERALALRERIGDRHGVINSRVTLAASLIDLGRLDRARAELDLAGAAHAQIDNLGLGLQIAQQRVELAEASGDFREALRWQREATALHVAMAAQDQTTRVAELQARFDSDQQAREIELLRATAEVRELELQRQRLILQSGIVLGVLLLGVFALLVSRLRLGRISARKLEQVARTDPLTGLANRRDIIEKIELERTRCLRSGRPFALVMADIDQFKAINDQHGHGVGDRVLIEVARRLRARVRGQDCVARWGGEEFLLLLPDTDMGGAAALSEQLRATVAGSPCDIDGQAIDLSLTLGVCQFRSGMSLDDCVQVADEALYAGKRAGRNRVVLGHARAGDGAPVSAPAAGDAGAGVAAG